MYAVDILILNLFGCNYFVVFKVEQYMMFLPNSKVPRLGSDGLTYRAQQLTFQLPLHDFSDNYTKFLPDDQKEFFHNAVETAIRDSLGRGGYDIWLIDICI